MHDGAKGPRNQEAEIESEEQLRLLEAMIAKAAFKRTLGVVMICIATLAVALFLRLIPTAPHYYLALGRPIGLVWAAQEGDNRSIYKYAATGQSMNVQVVWGEHKSSPLCEAAENGRVESVRALLQCGADPNLCDGTGEPLYCAVAAESEPAVDALIAAGAKINLRSDNPSWSRGSEAFTTAIQIENEQMAIHLLKLGADPNSVSSGNSASFLAWWYGQYQLASMLQRAGADP